jgi:hypothetical protein
MAPRSPPKKTQTVIQRRSKTTPSRSRTIGATALVLAPHTDAAVIEMIVANAQAFEVVVEVAAEAEVAATTTTTTAETT